MIPCDLEPPFWIITDWKVPGKSELFKVVTKKPKWCTSCFYSGHLVCEKNCWGSDQDSYYLYKKYRDGNYGLGEEECQDAILATKDEIAKGEKLLHEWDELILLDAI